MFSWVTPGVSISGRKLNHGGFAYLFEDRSRGAGTCNFGFRHRANSAPAEDADADSAADTNAHRHGQVGANGLRVKTRSASDQHLATKENTPKYIYGKVYAAEAPSDWRQKSWLQDTKRQGRNDVSNKSVRLKAGHQLQSESAVKLNDLEQMLSKATVTISETKALEAQRRQQVQVASAKKQKLESRICKEINGLTPDQLVAVLTFISRQKPPTHTVEQ